MQQTATKNSSSDDLIDAIFSWAFPIVITWVIGKYIVFPILRFITKAIIYVIKHSVSFLKHSYLAVLCSSHTNPYYSNSYQANRGRF